MLGFTWFCPVPRISPCLRRFTPHMKRESRVVMHETAKYEKVSSHYESLDYDIVEDELTYLRRLKLGASLTFKVALQRTIVIILIGILAGIFGSLLEMSVKKALEVKMHFLKGEFKKYGDPGSLNEPKLFIYWFLTCILPALIACCLIIFVEPAAAGGGIPGIIGYLNGVNVPRIVKFKVLIIKLMSCFCILTADFAVGKEGPLMHAGVILGGCTPMMHVPFTSIHFFGSLRNDRERRDMASAGIAAGLTSAFSTPIGGVILAIEEGLTYCTVHLTYRIVLCALVTATTVFVISAILKGCIGCFFTDPIRFLEIEGKYIIYYYVSEMPFFILLGIVGGILGSMWNCLEMQMTLIRLKYVKKKYEKIIDTMILAAATCSFSFLIIRGLKNCRKVHGEEKEHLLQMHCPKGQYATTGLFFFQSAEEVIKALINDEEPIGLVPLLSYTIYYFILSSISMGGSFSAGIFVPNLILGASWGRLLGEMTIYVFPSTKKWYFPQKFAFLGAGAQLCGTNRICLSLGILMFESSGSIDFGLPIFITLITTKFIADVLTHPIYHAECLLKGIPLLDKSPPAFVSWVSLKDIMSRDVDVLPKITTVDTIMDTLKRTAHNGFPVVEPGRTSIEMGIESYGLLLGLILRSQLLLIIKHRLYKISPYEENFWKIMQKHTGASIKISDLEVLPEEGKQYVNLLEFMNKSPLFVPMGTSLTTGYHLIATLGIRHLIIVNNSNEVVGMVTRKDVSVYKTVITCCTVETRRVPLVTPN